MRFCLPPPASTLGLALRGVAFMLLLSCSTDTDRPSSSSWSSSAAGASDQGGGLLAGGAGHGGAGAAGGASDGGNPSAGSGGAGTTIIISETCSTCLKGALASADGCTTQLLACAADVNEAPTCTNCKTYLTQLAGGTVGNIDKLCDPSRLLMESLFNCGMCTTCATDCPDDIADVDCDPYTGGQGGEPPLAVFEPPACTGVPAEAPSAGSCITIAGDMLCNPVTNAGCTGGTSCDTTDTGADCLEPPVNQPLCAPCGTEGLCAPGMFCVNATCTRYCCTNDDCGPSGECKTTLSDGATFVFEGVAETLGYCVAL